MGGAGYFSHSDVRITGCSFENNTAISGGALGLHSHPTTIASSRFISNTATADGGAIIFEFDTESSSLSGSLNITHSSVFLGNTAGKGNVLTCSNGYLNLGPNTDINNADINTGVKHDGSPATPCAINRG